MEIQNSTLQDIDEIFHLYQLARALQAQKYIVIWPEFDRTLIETEINELRQWKLMINGRIACIWATTFADPQIWEERDIDPSVYIHRIATHPDFRGQNLVCELVNWVKTYAAQNNKQYIRMDTVGNNTGLISHYQKCGFAFLGLLTLKDTSGLPAHYDKATVSLFEIDLKKLISDQTKGGF
jgi:ribosomal protein S18 acetylase RimI-like enzyme